MTPSDYNSVPQQFNARKRAAELAGEDANKRQRLNSNGPTVPGGAMANCMATQYQRNSSRQNKPPAKLAVHASRSLLTPESRRHVPTVRHAQTSNTSLATPYTVPPHLFFPLAPQYATEALPLPYNNYGDTTMQPRQTSNGSSSSWADPNRFVAGGYFSAENSEGAAKYIIDKTTQQRSMSPAVPQSYPAPLSMSANRAGYDHHAPNPLCKNAYNVHGAQHLAPAQQLHYPQASQPASFMYAPTLARPQSHTPPTLQEKRQRWFEQLRCDMKRGLCYYVPSIPLLSGLQGQYCQDNGLPLPLSAMLVLRHLHPRSRYIVYRYYWTLASRLLVSRGTEADELLEEMIKVSRHLRERESHWYAQSRNYGTLGGLVQDQSQFQWTLHELDLHKEIPLPSSLSTTATLLVQQRGVGIHLSEAAPSAQAPALARISNPARQFPQNAGRAHAAVSRLWSTNAPDPYVGQRLSATIPPLDSTRVPSSAASQITERQCATPICPTGNSSSYAVVTPAQPAHVSNSPTSFHSSLESPAHHAEGSYGYETWISRSPSENKAAEETGLARTHAASELGSARSSTAQLHVGKQQGSGIDISPNTSLNRGTKRRILDDTSEQQQKIARLSSDKAPSSVPQVSRSYPVQEIIDLTKDDDPTPPRPRTPKPPVKTFEPTKEQLELEALWKDDQRRKELKSASKNTLNRACRTIKYSWQMLQPKKYTDPLSIPRPEVNTESEKLYGIVVDVESYHKPNVKGRYFCEHHTWENRTACNQGRCDHFCCRKGVTRLQKHKQIQEKINQAAKDKGEEPPILPKLKPAQPEAGKEKPVKEKTLKKKDSVKGQKAKASAPTVEQAIPKAGAEEPTPASSSTTNTGTSDEEDISRAILEGLQDGWDSE